MTTPPEHSEVLQRLSKDLKAAAASMSVNEARYMVDAYYEVQDYRKAANNQFAALERSEEPNAVIDWLGSQHRTVESQIQRALSAWSDNHRVGRWARSIVGIGPVISAGLLAHIDITEAPTAGHIWRYAGLDPTSSWNKGEKRPWNASLKTLCWKIGESFVKVQANEDDFYGKIYVARKEREAAKNASLDFADQAAAKLERFKIGKDTDAYKAYSAGLLPPAHIHSRAKRYAVKLFLAHYQHVAYWHEFGAEPPKPYAIEHMGHADVIKPPNFDQFFPVERQKK